MSVDWSYFERFEVVNGKYLPDTGEGKTKATQTVTAVNKLVYKWYNDGDVFDNTHGMDGWWNDLSSYANWLYFNAGGRAREILDSIGDCYNGDDYEELLKRLADDLLDAEYIEELNKNPKTGSIYKCAGPFRFEEHDDEDDEEDY